MLGGKDGDLVEDEVADLDAAAEAGGHVGGNPVAVDGKGGQHGGALGGGDLEEVGEGEVGEAGDFEGGDGEAEGVADEVGDHGGDDGDGGDGGDVYGGGFIVLGDEMKDMR